MRYSIPALLGMVLLTGCGAGPISYADFRSAGQSYHDEMAAIYSDFYSAVEDGDSTRAMSIAKAGAERAQRFQHEVLSHTPGACFKVAFDLSTETTADQVSDLTEQSQGRSFPKPVEIAFVESVRQLPYGWQNALDEADC